MMTNNISLLRTPAGRETLLCESKTVYVVSFYLFNKHNSLINWEVGLKCLHTSIFIETPSLERLPTKTKENLSPHEIRLFPLDINPIFPSLGKLLLILLIISLLLLFLFLLKLLIKNSLLFLWGKLAVWFCSLQFLHVLTSSTPPPFGVDALPQYYHLTSFNYGDVKAREVIWAILCLIVPPMIIER